MSIVIQLTDGSPQKQRGEKMAGVILTRDPQLGFRMKVQALPSRREIHRLVSDCPLAITEQTLLWLQRHKWQWKLHPNSLDIKELLKQVKTYTDLLPPDSIGQACDLLLENFRPKGTPTQGNQNRAVQSTGQQAYTNQAVATPNPEQMMQQMAIMQQQMISMQQQLASGGAPVQQVALSPEQQKLANTHARHAAVMAQVNETLEYNARKEAFQEEVVENLDAIVEEVDNLIVDEELDDTTTEIDVPEMFENPEAAWEWAVELGVYDDLDEAKDEYNGLKASEKPGNAKEMAELWTGTCIEIYNLLNDDEESEG